MRNLLDNELLNGPHTCRITFRPERNALTVRQNNVGALLDVIRRECQFWGGAANPLVPLDAAGRLLPEYAEILPGSSIDHLVGLEAFGLYHLGDQVLTAPVSADAWGRQLAAALLKWRAQDEYRHLEVVQLDERDPWRLIYLACLGHLPDTPDSDILRDTYLREGLAFEDFVHVDRVVTTGSLTDLTGRLTWQAPLNPRSLSMVHLGYGSSGSSSIRYRNNILPEPGFARFDAGPNVVVACSGASVADYVLLWNLRGAHGDARTLPIGIPAEELTGDALRTLAVDPNVSRAGVSEKSLYLTSASLDAATLKKLLGAELPDFVAVADYGELLTFGHPPGWSRDEILTWQQGTSHFIPLPPDHHREIVSERGLNGHGRMYVDLAVLEAPLPQANDVRLDAMNFEIYAGSQSTWGSTDKRSEARRIQWPSRLLLAEAVAAHRGLSLQESEPGRAARVALLGLTDVADLSYLAHAPLLNLLEDMAARQGFGWYKQRLRDAGQQPRATDAVGPTTDELPEQSFNEFKRRAFSGNERATKCWLFWAERAGLIIKGFQLQCPKCRARQWIPVAAFTPPIICRGCTQGMETPFGDRPNVDFRYRLSERLRRVYEHDAMGHLLVLRYFDFMFHTAGGSRTIGSHPGLEVRRLEGGDVMGEADVMLFLRDGSFVPCEVKRTANGFSSRDLQKLNTLCEVLKAPWSVAAVCQYGHDVGSEFPQIESREAISRYFRIVLSYDVLLDPLPIWALGDDPFHWRTLSSEDIAQREKDFVRRLAQHEGDKSDDWLAHSMTRKPGQALMQPQEARNTEDMN